MKSEEEFRVQPLGCRFGFRVQSSEFDEETDRELI